MLFGGATDGGISLKMSIKLIKLICQGDVNVCRGERFLFIIRSSLHALPQTFGVQLLKLGFLLFSVHSLGFLHCLT